MQPLPVLVTANYSEGCQSWALICVNIGGRRTVGAGGGRSLPQWESGGIIPIFGNLYGNPYILGTICAIVGPQNGPILLR